MTAGKERERERERDSNEETRPAQSYNGITDVRWGNEKNERTATLASRGQLILLHVPSAANYKMCGSRKFIHIDYSSSMISMKYYCFFTMTFGKVLFLKLVDHKRHY